MLTDMYHVEIGRQRKRELREAARRQRFVADSLPPRRIRRALGRSMIRIGSRLAAEPARQWARLP